MKPASHDDMIERRVFRTLLVGCFAVVLLTVGFSGGFGQFPMSQPTDATGSAAGGASTLATTGSRTSAEHQVAEAEGAIDNSRAQLNEAVKEMRDVKQQ